MAEQRESEHRVREPLVPNRSAPTACPLPSGLGSACPHRWLPVKVRVISTARTAAPTTCGSRRSTHTAPNQLHRRVPGRDREWADPPQGAISNLAAAHLLPPGARRQRVVDAVTADGVDGGAFAGAAALVQLRRETRAIVWRTAVTPVIANAKTAIPAQGNAGTAGGGGVPKAR